MATCAARDGSWKLRAACRGMGADLFFPVGESESDPDVASQVRAAKAVCAVCPVREQCREAGLREEGIWAGLTERERRRLRR